MKTWVLYWRRRNAVEWITRSRSRWKAVRRAWLGSGRARKGDHHCKIQDLSLGGMSFIYPEKLLSADYVSIVLPPPAGVVTRKKVEEAYLEAHVCRVVPAEKYPGQFQIGVRFVLPQAE